MIPIQPKLRTNYHFEENALVMVFWNRKDGWKLAQVVEGYKHHQGYVSFHLLDGTCSCGNKSVKPSPSAKPLNPYDSLNRQCPDNARKWADAQAAIDQIGVLTKCPGLNVASLRIMLKDEYDYFMNHPDEYEGWMQAASGGREYPKLRLVG